ncbi:MAG: DNA polymerase III subunit gamma/tau [Bdellovibrionaceae bacterium]|nr:DNA polymerase III subunit gamma/tau [Pseudobdellovibrionaceae bacterium]
MAYEVIARKWRPLNFDQLLGQEHISQTLKNAITNKRLSHAFLFTGPRGTGKTSASRILAKTLRCENNSKLSKAEPCNACDQCLKITAGQSLDVLEIDGASNNGVDAIREIRETIKYMPSSGTYKLYIIDEVHMLSNSAFNALLKTLEEPPPHVIFILATTEVQKIPDTVLSRCQRFDFRRISISVISQHLENICKQENITPDKQSLFLIAKHGEGSMRDSQSLLDQVITFSGKTLSLEKSIQILGLTPRELLNLSLEVFVTAEVEKSKSLIENLSQSSVDPKVFLGELIEEIRHLLLIKTCPSNVENLIPLSVNDQEHLSGVAKKLSHKQIYFLFKEALNAYEDCSKMPDPFMILEFFLLKLPYQIHNLENFSTTVGATQTKSFAALNTAGPKASAVKNSTQTLDKNKNATMASAPTNSFSEQPDFAYYWTSLVKKIASINPPLSSKLSHTFLQTVENKIIKIGVPKSHEFLLEEFSDKNFTKKLKNYIKTFWNRDYDLEFFLSYATEHQKSLSGQIQQQEEAETTELQNKVDQNDLVQQIKKELGINVKSIKKIKN